MTLIAKPGFGYDIPALLAELDGIAIDTSPGLVKQKSRDFYWYSPVLRGQLDGCAADVIASPRTEDEVVRIAAACARLQIPMTPRGAGTGNYGQAVPLRGGVVVSMAGMNAIGPVEDGVVRVGPGVLLRELETRTREAGWELRMFPSTVRTASVGGFIAGGSGGVGSITYGQLRDRGSLLGARVVTAEATPRVLDLTGDAVNRVLHAYGTNGIITELTLPLAPAVPWVEIAVSFPEFMTLAEFCLELAESPGIMKRLVTAVAAPLPSYFRTLAVKPPADQALGLLIVAASGLGPTRDLIERFGGHIVYAKREAEVTVEGLVPVYEFTWNHTTLQVLKVDKSLTYLQSQFPGPNPLPLVKKLADLFGDEVWMHLEFIRIGGRVGCSALPVVRYTTEARLNEIIAIFESHGVLVFNPHTYVLEDGGMKVTDPAQLAFKYETDPMGLLNPGKMRGVAGASRRMSIPVLDVVGPESVSFHTSDGVRLDADLYRPKGDGPYPVLLMRQPYGRRIASTVCYAHPSWYAAHGFLVVIQDVRGRGTSEGTFRLFADDARDGAETVAWAASLPGANGAVGMYGFSYQGTNQFLAASRGVPQLKALAPAMIGWDVRHDWAFENGAFCLRAGLGWAIQMAAENARLAGDTEAFEALYRASRALPLTDSVPVRPAVMARFRDYGHYLDWLDEPAGSPYWQSISPHVHAERLAAGPPALLVGGWYDSHLPGTLAAYRDLVARGLTDCRLVVGPWSHFPWGQRVGCEDFGPAAVGTIDQLQVRWFERWLKPDPAALDDQPPVRLFDLGTRSWRDFDAWPSHPFSLFLASTGRAALDQTAGTLAMEPPAQSLTEYLVHDPWRAVPTTGGPFGAPPGPADRGDVDARPDVLTFTTERLSAPLSLAGSVTAELAIDSDAASFDVSCVLSCVDESGWAMNFAEGYCSVGAPTGSPVIIPMRAACYTVRAGERLRLSVAAASFPAYPVNPGTGIDPTQATLADARIITLRVTCDGLSRLILGQVSAAS